MRTTDNQGSKASSDRTLSLWSDCVDAQTDLIIHFTHLATCALCWIAASLVLWSNVNAPSKDTITASLEKIAATAMDSFNILLAKSPPYIVVLFKTELLYSLVRSEII